MRSTRVQIFLRFAKAKKCKRKRPYGVECTFFNAFASLKFAIVLLYLVNAFVFSSKKIALIKYKGESCFTLFSIKKLFSQIYK